MKKFNIIIAKRGRDAYLKKCLEFLDIANSEQKYDVKVYICYDDEQEFFGCQNLSIEFIQCERVSELFNKSVLLNTGLKCMRKCDYISIVDIDILYCSDFFDRIIQQVDEKTWFISGGYKLTKKFTEDAFDLNLKDNLSQGIDIVLKHENDKKMYPSQITISMSLYQQILKILQTDKLYDERFEGWGGEDSVLSLLSSELQRRKVVKKIYDFNIWYHLWHEKDVNHNYYHENQKLFQDLVRYNRHKAAEICR